LNKKTLLSAFLTAIMIGGLVLASATRFGTVQASTDVSGIPKPSVPEFTLQLVDNFVQVTIRNQPIIPNGHDTANIFYNIRMKSHDIANWDNTTVSDPSQGSYVGEVGTSGSTTLYTSFNSIHDLIGRYDSFQVDFQVEAINGYLNSSILYGPLPIGVDPNSRPVIIVNTSGWSNTQTITIPESQMPTPSPATTPTPTPHQEPQQTALTTIIGVTIAAAVLGAGLGLLIYLIKRK
jgi:hypothetical protein